MIIEFMAFYNAITNTDRACVLLSAMKLDPKASLAEDSFNLP